MKPFSLNLDGFQNDMPYRLRVDIATNFQENSLKILWKQILERNIPLMLHNGLVDLIFLYQQFYADLPEKLAEFVTNISDWFPDASACIYDSKYFSEYCVRMNASFLEYVFRKWWFC